MPQPARFLKDQPAIAAIVERFTRRACDSGLSYATVRDYCESADLLPQITGTDGDLKNVQRPWAVKAVLGCKAPPARVLEIGGGEPVVSGLLSELGYAATLVDPYDGFGNGPTDYERYRQRFPHVNIVRDYFRSGMQSFAPRSFDVIFSVSVLEHIPTASLVSCFDGIIEYLAPGGVSAHCFDFVLEGAGVEHARGNAQQILAQQQRISGGTLEVSSAFDELLARLRGDLEAFYLSPQGHHNWRGGQTYEQFPFRKVVSVQTIAPKPA
jgi:hypothetical protein